MSDEKTNPQTEACGGPGAAGDTPLTKAEILRQFQEAYSRYGRHIALEAYARAWYQSYRLWDDESLGWVYEDHFVADVARVISRESSTDIKYYNPDNFSEQIKLFNDEKAS